MTTEPTQTPLSQQRDWMETAERAERYAENAAYWRAKAKSATQRIAELESRVKQLEAIEREATIRIVELQAEIAGMSPHYFPPPKWNGLQVNMSTGEPLPPSPPAVEVERWAKEKAAHKAGKRIQHRWRQGSVSEWSAWSDIPEKIGPLWINTAWDEYRIHPDDDAPPVQPEEKA